MAGGMAMSGKSIDLKNSESPINSTVSYTATEKSINRILKSQMEKNMLLSRGILNQLYEEGLGRGKIKNATNSNSETTKKLADRSERLDLKFKALNILADLYHKKKNPKRAKRDLRIRWMEGNLVDSNYAITLDSFDEISAVLNNDPNSRRNETNIYYLTTSCNRVSDTTR